MTRAGRRTLETTRSRVVSHGAAATAYRAAVLACALLATCAGPSETPPATSVATAARVEDALSTTTGSVPVSEPSGNPTDDPTTSRPAAVTEFTAAEDEPRDPVLPGLPELSVLKTLPHDPAAFTQGLVLHRGRFYESTGLYGRSTVRIVEPATGEVLSSVRLDDRYFGEGLEVTGDRVVQLTWKEETAFIWDAETLDPLGTYTYEGEGWGLCAFEDRFVMSNGSSRLTYRDLETFEVVGGVHVVLGGEPVERLNELECVGDLVYANVWMTDEIMVIASDSGRVVALVEASSLRSELSSSDGIDVLNGIAHDPDRRVFYLTGKLWPEIFEVRIEPGR